MHVPRYLIPASAAALLVFLPASSAFSASTIYWCPDRKSDQQYAANPGPGCVPLVDKTESALQEGTATAQEPAREYRIDNLQQDVSAFLRRYRHFLECCKTDLTELSRIEALGDDVAALLAATQTNLSNYSLVAHGIILRELIPPVAKARADLRTLRAKLERIAELSQQGQAGSLEAAGRASREIRNLEESIDRDIRPPQLPSGPRTGLAIGVAPAAGPNIGKTPTTGVDIGREGTTGMEIGVTPRHSSDIGGSGPTGFEIGGTGRAGPSIGESVFNNEDSSRVGSSLQRSTVGSTISDSSVGSSLRPSTIGSTLQDSSIGSSFGGSSIGSSLEGQSR